LYILLTKKNAIFFYGDFTDVDCFEYFFTVIVSISTTVSNVA